MKWTAYLPHDFTCMGVYQQLADGGRYSLGTACFHPAHGWKFTTGQPRRRGSVKWHATLGRCLPRWLAAHGNIVKEYEVYQGKLVGPDFRALAPVVGKEG